MPTLLPYPVLQPEASETSPEGKELELAQEIVEVPITGKVISVEVKPGNSVKEGDVICFIESMKMENPILSPVSGKVSEVKVSVGEVVETGRVIAVIEY